MFMYGVSRENPTGMELVLISSIWHIAYCLLLSVLFVVAINMTLRAPTKVH